MNTHWRGPVQQAGPRAECNAKGCKMAVTYSPVVTDTDFAQEVEQHEGVTMVDFWAAWCGPCHMISPIVEEIAEGV